jgi:hypothetical protein
MHEERNCRGGRHHRHFKAKGVIIPQCRITLCKERGELLEDQTDIIVDDTQA